VDHLIAVAEQFGSESKVLDIQEYGSGNVNDTFLVTLNHEKEKNFILQRINTQVFLRPRLIIQNIRTFTEHIGRRLKHEQIDSSRRWEVPRIFSAKDGKDYFIDSHGSFWRAISFIDGSRSYETIQNIEHAREAGYALGRFQSLISDLDTRKLYDTLEGFHIAPQYLQHYDEVLARSDLRKESPELKYCLQLVMKRRKWASILEDAKNQNRLFLRPIHGDPKVNNIMIDEITGQAVSLVDLDTVKPGLVHYDIGDCLRSCCNPLGEETNNIEDVHFETAICKAILQGYISIANCFLNKNDYSYLYDSIRLIAFELGLRFLTDYLEGNVYFKAKHKEHNLLRALVQFKLTESIESQEADIRTLIDDLIGG
jgi:Ser/Thr protein kinase RdoA (MazF antagonist)